MRLLEYYVAAGAVLLSLNVVAFKSARHRICFQSFQRTTAIFRHMEQTPKKGIGMMALDDPNEALTKFLPDKDKFNSYFKKVVGSTDMMLPQFIAYSEVENLLEDGLISDEDVNDLWVSAVGDATGLTVDEAYEMLCMVLDLPDPEDVEFFDKEFKELADGKDLLPFYKFLSWGDIQDIINEKALTMEEITEIWRNIAGDLNASIDRKLFTKINNVLDKAIEANEEDEIEVETTDVEGGLDIWSPSFDASSVFDDESLVDITTFFKENSNKDGLIDFETMSSWSDLKEMIGEGAITTSAWESAWKEATRGNISIDFDTFLRLNVRLDLIMDDLESSDIGDSPEKLPSSSPAAVQSSMNFKQENDAENFYRSEFERLTSGGKLLRLDMLLQWKDIKELIDDGVVKASQIERMFEGMPKEPMGIPATAYGITEDTFVAFNGMLDVLLDSMEPEVIPGTKSKGVTPSQLVSEPQRPLPAAKELKIGDMGAALDTEGEDGEMTTGLSESELELMKVLDNADNMLNSGSFGDFDKLIGDVNDPRLQALREKRDGADEVEGGLDDVLSELIELSRKQSRCGLDRPDEMEAARIRDLVQAVIERAPRAASRDIKDLLQSINGEWKMLFTNSEMFNFYNGITGFANVFPASKFQDLKLKYKSDGYLSEALYVENLATPLGPVDATVFSNWDLMKEMSFMTNENSVVLRSYCSKVTAGPMEYEAQENWKSLRTMSMNEILYVDSEIMLMRNCGALRIYFVLERL